LEEKRSILLTTGSYLLANEAKKEVSEKIGDLAKSIMEIEFKGVRLPVTMKIHNNFSIGD